jgi:hypothetical protein
MKTIPDIVTLIPSARWRSSVQFHLGQVMTDARISATLDFQDCLSEVGQLQPVAAIVEMTANRLLAFCTSLEEKLPCFPHTIFVAVGNQDLLPWLSLLRICGFCDICCDVAEARIICQRIKRHADATHADRTDEKLETVILGQLPWIAFRAGIEPKRQPSNQG